MLNTINILEFMAFLAGILSFTKIKQSFLYIVLILIIYAFINEMAAWFYSDSTKKSNLAFYCIYCLFSFELFFFIFKNLLVKENIRGINKIILFTFPIIWLFETFVNAGFSRYPTYTMYLGCLLVVFFSSRSLREILEDKEIKDLRFYSPFWFVTGTLFFHFLLITYIFIYNNISSKDIQAVNKYVLTVGNVIFYPFTTISFLCQLKREK